MTGDLSAVKVKTECPDEAEIRELAAKMVEANKAKALAASAAAARAPVGMIASSQPPGPNGQMGILNFLTRKTPTNPAVSSEKKSTEQDSDKKAVALDDSSWKGHFGWDMLGKCHVPYIFRQGEKYVAVRMVEVKLLNKYLNYLHQDIYSCTCIRSYYITDIESRLLNEINIKHCDNQFGREMFTQKDLVVRLSDANEFYNFLDVCYNKLINGTANSKDKCGFIRINKESVVPYTVRDSQKFVPLFYFEGETENLKQKADQLEGWDLSYLKFCCKVQGIRNELFASETCAVISLTDITTYFPPGTEFEEYWPNKVMDSQLLISSKGGPMSSGGGQWTRAPSAPAPVVGVTAGNTNAVVNSVAGGRRRIQQMATAMQQQRHSAAMQAAAVTQNNIAATVQALQAGWTGLINGQPPFGTAGLAQTQVFRIAQAQAQAVAARYAGGSAGNLGAAATLSSLAGGTASSISGTAGINTSTQSNHRANAVAMHQRQMQFPTNAAALGMAMAQQQQQQQQVPPISRNSTGMSVNHAGRNTTANNVAQVGIVNAMNGHSMAHHGEPVKRLITIPDVPTSGTHIPYKVQKALVEGTMVPCVNLKPYVYTELLMTLPDLVQSYFPGVSVATCRQVLDVLGLELFRPNKTQLAALRQSGKCKNVSAGENALALVQIRDVMQYMPQLKYMLERGLPDDGSVAAHMGGGASVAQPAKRARAS